jgi:hypothetical protein
MARKKREEPGLVEQLKEAIRASEYSLEGLEKAAGLSLGSLSRFMRDQRTLTLPAAEKVCRLLRLALVPQHPEEK